MATVELPPGFIEGIASGIAPDYSKLTPEQQRYLDQLYRALQGKPTITYEGSQTTDNSNIVTTPQQTLSEKLPSGGIPPPMGGAAPVPGVSAVPIPEGFVAGLNSQLPKVSTSLISKWLLPNLGTIIPAASGVAGALIGKSASDNATEAQTEAADKALALNERMYEQDRKDYEPYRNVGQFSLQQLGHLTGMPANFGTDAVTAATTPRTAVPRQPTSTGEPLGPQSILQTVRNQVAQAQQMNNPAFQTLRDLGAARQTSSSFVRMKAPDGEEADVSPEEVSLMERYGARRL